jgi:preprotein translocase subunit SecE
MANEKSNLPESEKRKGIARDDDSGESRFSFSQVREFTNEVKAEFGKIAWPNKKNTAGSAMLVVILLTIMSLYLGAVDLLVGKMISYILK